MKCCARCQARIGQVLLDTIGRGIEPGAPAQRSDLSPGDVITKVDGKQVAVASDLQREILGKKIGEAVQLEVWRNGRTLRLEGGASEACAIRLEKKAKKITATREGCAVMEKAG